LNTLRYADRVKERNAETGESALPYVVTKSPRRSVSKDFSNASSTDMVSNHSISSQNSQVLDDLLASPSTASDDEFDEDKATRLRPQRSELDGIADELIAAHKDCMSVMLDMVKEEMDLVNDADSNRNDLDGYLAKVLTLHDEQLAMVMLLREQLLQFRLAQAERAGSDRRYLEDDSFEDLRD
jgi:hypothetical protein